MHSPELTMMAVNFRYQSILLPTLSRVFFLLLCLSGAAYAHSANPTFLKQGWSAQTAQWIGTKPLSVITARKGSSKRILRENPRL